MYDSANPAGSTPRAPQPNEPAPVLYGESVTFTETSTPAPNSSPAYGAPADPSAATFSAPAYSASVDPNAAAFNAPAYGGAPAAEPPINMPWYGIDFLNAIKRFFTKYATFSGRASRGEFWWVMLFLFLVSFVFNLLTRASSFFNVLSAIWGLAILVPQIALAVRRVHDANLPGGWVALPYGIEVVGAMVISFSMVGTVASGLSGSSSGLSGGVVGMLIGALIVLSGAVTAIVLFAKQSDPQGARFDRR